MGETKIAWTAVPKPDGTFLQGYTYNPWIGCTKKDEGCLNCYAETFSDRFMGGNLWGVTANRKKTVDQNILKVCGWNRRAKKENNHPLLFCASLADVFEDHPQLDDWRKELFHTIDLNRELVWLLLTKRPENVLSMVQRATGRAYQGWFVEMKHVWIGCTASTQERLEERAEYMRQIPAIVRFVSHEPGLEALQLKDHADWIDWFITGGESGAKCRPYQVEWAREMLQECQSLDIPFFMKQLGGHPDKKDTVNSFPEDLRVRQFPKAYKIGG